MSKKYSLLTFKGICMDFLLKLKYFILGHPVTSKQPHKIVQVLLGHPVLRNSSKFKYTSVYVPDTLYLCKSKGTTST